MTEPVDAMDVGQADYMKLFMQELTYQDPLKPVDNREFMAQMAQFSALQQAVTTNDKLDQLISINYVNRGINLLGKKVRVSGAEGYHDVEAIRFSEEQPEVRVVLENAETGEWITLDKVTEITKENDDV